MTWIQQVIFYVVKAFQRLRDYVMDCVYEAVLPGMLGECGSGVRIRYPSQITGPQCARIGSNVHINRGAFIRAEGGLEIGDNVHIGRNLVLYTRNHDYEGAALPYDDGHVEKPVIIGRNVWIGINVTIIPGVSIGEGAIVGAGCVVCADVPPFAIVGLPHQRIIGHRDEAHYGRLDQQRRYGGIGGKPLGNRRDHSHTGGGKT